MMTEEEARLYQIETWKQAFREAEIDVMRSTATPTGGRVPTETLVAYVNRTRAIQQAAVDRAFFAEAEIKRLKSQGDAS